MLIDRDHSLAEAGPDGVYGHLDLFVHKTLKTVLIDRYHGFTRAELGHINRCPHLFTHKAHLICGHNVGLPTIIEVTNSKDASISKFITADSTGTP